MPRTILIIDDEADMIRLLDHHLTRSNYLVLSARDGTAGLAMARKYHPDLIILDIMMPGLDGLEVCKQLRQEPATARVPLLMLTAKGEESDRVVGLELGADDYLSKPFGMKELLARIKALYRRAETTAEPGEVLRAGKLVIDSGRRTVTLAEKTIPMTATQFNLLRALVERRGRVLVREDLIELACGEDASAFERTIDVHVSTIRQKLGKFGTMIETVRGVGYRLKEE